MGTSSVLIPFFKKMVEDVRPTKSFNLWTTPLERIFNYSTQSYFNAHPQLANAMVESMYSNYVRFGGAPMMQQYGNYLEPGGTAGSQDSFNNLLKTFQPNTGIQPITVVSQTNIDNLGKMYRETWPNATGGQSATIQ